MPSINCQIVNNHRQIDQFSCIPSCVEIILKLLGRVPADYYDLQRAWDNRINGSFADFHNKTIEGLTFQVAFALPRGEKFPLTDLFSTIEKEIQQGRYVAVSIANHLGFHMYVIYDIDENGEFLSVSKYYEKTIPENFVRKAIADMQGTDILLYSE